MKRYFRSCACAISLTFLAGPPASPHNQLFTLTIAKPKEPLKAGTELHLSITVKNTSSRAISFTTALGVVPEDGYLYQIDVRDAQGRPAPPSAYIRNRNSLMPVFRGSQVARTLKPGESLVDQVSVTTFCDLSQPGKYTISVARSIPPRQDLGEGKISSNAVTVTVVP